MFNKANLPAYQLAYETYVKVKQMSDEVSDTCKLKFRRQIQMMVCEAGFNGVNTGLISKNALTTLIKQKKKMDILSHNRLSTEHPITPRVIVNYILQLDRVLSFEEFYDVWFNNYVYTKTTNEENQYLKKFQSNFQFGDCWKEMYEDAGIDLVKCPRLDKDKLDSIAKEYGIVI